MSCGLMVIALGSCSAAPVNSESTRAPRLSVWATAYSLATRFIPSRSEETTMTSEARYRATISGKG